jgi:SAM-dependent methyltransferase
VNSLNDFEDTYAVEDEHFDMIYPPDIRELSRCHWTPVAVARKAAKFLVREPGTRVLDIGCGPGKFCIVGALTSAGHFTGVEQRLRLAKLAETTVQREKIPNAEIIHTNITEIDFSAYDSFYLFNPFEENFFAAGPIDSTVRFSDRLYERYTRHVATQLARAPLGTRLVTYYGFCEEVPIGYECEEYSLCDALKLWRKTRECPVEAPSSDAGVAESRWRS